MTQVTFATHEVLNQSPPFEDVDLFALDRPLVDAVAANGGAFGGKGIVRIRQALGFGGDGGAGPRRQREHAKAADASIRAATGATKSNFIPPITS